MFLIPTSQRIARTQKVLSKTLASRSGPCAIEGEVWNHGEHPQSPRVAITHQGAIKVNVIGNRVVDH